jgi:hypothetical protein
MTAVDKINHNKAYMNLIGKLERNHYVMEVCTTQHTSKENQEILIK